MSIPKVGLSRLLKEGTRSFQGIEESILRNIEACSDLANTVRSAFGPNGMNKMVINNIQKLFVTNDAATIIKELQIEHPAAKILVMASEMQEQEIGDGTNTVIILAASLLENAEELIRMGLNPTEISDGYEKACKKALETLPDLVCGTIKDLTNIDEVVKGIRPAIMSKQRGYEDLLSKLVAEACVKVLPKDPLLFSVDNIRVCKILGSGVLSSFLMNGMVFKKGIEGAVRKVNKANIAVFSCPFDITQLETKVSCLVLNITSLKRVCQKCPFKNCVNITVLLVAWVKCDD
ncbi:unnamed protein product [Soboliphyme baturini]|uniref:T-complex protein 1 subunit theta n=1 Tax=Soboliphyme baturini TaxID=241478 RepID=A0A183IDP7_9BILA|nr:unnamed protein product [Soboliphyme baturini]